MLNQMPKPFARALITTFGLRLSKLKSIKEHTHDERQLRRSLFCSFVFVLVSSTKGKRNTGHCGPEQSNQFTYGLGTFLTLTMWFSYCMIH